MHLSDAPYNRYAICGEMLEAADLFSSYSWDGLDALRALIARSGRVFLTGEGSSRLFPAGNVVTRSLARPGRYVLRTEAALQAMEYDLSGYVVLGLSNSGRTKEVVQLFDQLAAAGHPAFYSVTANPGRPPLTARATGGLVLRCGAEKAVAATKSVMEQALLLDMLLWEGPTGRFPSVQAAAGQLSDVLQQAADPAIVAALSRASRIYLAGRDNGVGEELALKTNEIIRKPSMFLPGSYALHGIEEVMDPTEVMLLIDPFPGEEEKFRQVFEKNIGMQVFAIAPRQTLFPTMVIPNGGFFSRYLELAAGWNLLVEAGIRNGVDLDKGLRARKIGNEV